jgi:hypothetical protein
MTISEGLNVQEPLIVFHVEPTKMFSKVKYLTLQFHFYRVNFHHFRFAVMNLFHLQLP